MKVIIIDDEKKGRESLQVLVEQYCNDVEVVALAADADEGFQLITEHKPDLVFLDVEMPQGNGFALLERFDEIYFHIVFTTAHEDYAIQAIKKNALDYLLKPIDIEELKIAVQKARKTPIKKNIQNTYTGLLLTKKVEYTGRIALPVKEGVVYLPVADIIRVESDGSYSVFYSTDKKKYMVSKNLGEYEDILPSKEFFRIHKSHLVNIYRVKKYIRTDGYFAELEDGSIIEISRRKKDEFLQLMENLSR